MNLRFPYFNRMNTVIFGGGGEEADTLTHDYKAKHISASNSKSAGEFNIITSWFSGFSLSFHTASVHIRIVQLQH